MDTKELNTAQGHWILARMGKKILRPGGKELTKKMIAALEISGKDDIAEFAPGLGYTASLALAEKPHSYIGVDINEDAIRLLKGKIKGKNIRFILGNAAETPLENQSKDKVYGEAMLTMQADHRKAEIIKEAHRILKKGGLYAIHELSLKNVDKKLKSRIQKDLAMTIRVNARPLTEDEWKELLEREGFIVKKVFINDMLLLDFRRIIDDEGFFRALKIGLNILTHPQAAKRIREMRKVFKLYQSNLSAIAVIAEKK